MRLEQALFNYLSTHAAVTVVVGDRVYPLRRPQGCAYPALSYFRVSSPRIRTFSTNQGARSRVQVSCWAKSYLEAKAAADAVITALDGFDGTLGGPGGVPVKAIYLENETDDEEPETGVYHVAVDFTVWHEGN